MLYQFATVENDVFSRTVLHSRDGIIHGGVSSSLVMDKLYDNGNPLYGRMKGEVQV